MKRIAYSVVGLLLIVVLFSRLTTSGSENSAAWRNKLVVHEWGTFTSLEDENGKCLGSINADDEPVPRFVHQVMNSYALASQYFERTQKYDKGLPDQYPYVTLRLETPVMYFYPPQSQRQPMSINVDARFLGGWLTQFYPNAQTDTPQPKDLAAMAKTKIDHNTRSRLMWNGLKVGTQGVGPETTDSVWLAPRKVAAANVTAASGESERYLFYRGVGNIDSPLSVTSSEKKGELLLRANFEEVLPPEKTETIRFLWLVKIDANGSVAYRTLEPICVNRDRTKVVARVSSLFPEVDFSVENLSRLRKEMHAALVAAGLFDDEASAMLATWQNSYFRNGGWRLFFVVPREWTEHYLPVTISRPAEITRVMIGRIELISPEQRELLARLADSTISDSGWVTSIQPSTAAEKFISGHSDFGDLGVEIPPDYQTYLELGRFRNALIVDEQSRRPSAALAKFIDNYGLQPFRVTRPAGN